MSAANIHVTARAWTFTSPSSRPTWRCATWGTIAPRLKQGEIAVFIGPNLPERMERTMHGFHHLSEQYKTNVVGSASFFEHPASAHVTR